MNAFDKMASSPKPASKAKATKITASVNKYVKEAVDKVISIKASIKDLEADKLTTEAVIISHVRPQQDEEARTGNFSKSFDVSGNKGNLVYTTSDKFSVPQEDDDINEIKNLLKNKFEDFFEKERTVSLRPEVLKDDKLVNKIVSVLSKAGIADIFAVVDKYKSKKGLDEKQYNLDENDLDEFRTLVKQNKPALKY